MNRIAQVRKRKSRDFVTAGDIARMPSYQPYIKLAVSRDEPGVLHLRLKTSRATDASIITGCALRAVHCLCFPPVLLSRW